MSQTPELDQASFFDFIAQPGPAVLFLSVHPAHPFLYQLRTYFEKEAEIDVSFGQLSLMGLVESGSPVLTYLHGAILSNGVSVPFPIPPGYYLFQEGRMLAWESGLPTRDDTGRIFRGSLLGAIFSLYTRDPSFVGEALLAAATDAAAARVASRFRQAAAAFREQPRRESAYTQTTGDDLTRAYRLLQIEPTASDEEVNRAWRRLIQRFHPDRAARDPEEFDRLSRQCIEINRARDIIRAHRRRPR